MDLPHLCVGSKPRMAVKGILSRPRVRFPSSPNRGGEALYTSNKRSHQSPSIVTSVMLPRETCDPYSFLQDSRQGAIDRRHRDRRREAVEDSRHSAALARTTHSAQPKESPAITTTTARETEIVKMTCGYVVGIKSPDPTKH